VQTGPSGRCKQYGEAHDANQIGNDHRRVRAGGEADIDIFQLRGDRGATIESGGQLAADSQVMVHMRETVRSRHRRWRKEVGRGGNRRRTCPPSGTHSMRSISVACRRTSLHNNPVGQISTCPWHIAVQIFVDRCQTQAGHEQSAPPPSPQSVRWALHPGRRSRVRDALEVVASPLSATQAKPRGHLEGRRRRRWHSHDHRRDRRRIIGCAGGDRIIGRGRQRDQAQAFAALDHYFDTVHNRPPSSLGRQRPSSASQ